MIKILDQTDKEELQAIIDASKKETDKVVNQLSEEIDEFETQYAKKTQLNQLTQESAKQNAKIEAILNIFDASDNVNILPKDSLNGYYSMDDGTTFISSSNFRCTPTRIYITSKTLYIMINPDREMTESCIVAVTQFDSEDNYISTVSAYFTESGKLQTLTLANNVFSIYVWTNNRLELSDVCVGEKSFNEFQEYGAFNADSVILQSKDFHGKTIVNFGDSIFGNRRPPDDISTHLAKLTGATVHNCGFGGCRMSQHHNSNYDPFSMCRLADAIVSKDWTLQDTASTSDVPYYFENVLAILKELDFSKVDIITIAYGTNDFASDVNLDNTDNPHDTTTFAGALRYSVEKLLGAYPHLKIFVCSQTYRFWMDENNVFTEDSDTHQNGDGKKLTDFVGKTEEMTKELHLPYINNYDIGMNKYNRGYYFSETDGTHPLTVGCHLIAEHIAKELF